MVTNLVGGWLGARLGLNKTMNLGLMLQVVALGMLAAGDAYLGVAYVMAAQALSGIAKDLNKMSAKSAIKLLVPQNAEGTLYKWVAILTGSKNALKGVGFFLGGALLTWLGFQGAMLAMLAVLSLVWLLSLWLLKQDLGKAKNKAKFRELFSKSRDINILSAARLCLFAARDVWFVVALPVFLATAFAWDAWQVGSFLALWVIGYGVVQSLAPFITGIKSTGTKSTGINGTDKRSGRGPSGRDALRWAALLTAVPALIALGLGVSWTEPSAIQWVVLGGLMLFGFVFAVNSSLHSYLIVSMADKDGVSLDVGFYYMANAMGRLLGTVLSGWLFQVGGLQACLWVSCALLTVTTFVSRRLNTS